MRSTGAMIYGDDPSWVGVAYDRAVADRSAWQVLLALHVGETLGLEIHDGGAFHVLAPSADLAAGRLDRLVADVGSS